MDNLTLEVYWQDIPTGKDNAVDYPYLMAIWGLTERRVRALLHELSSFDNGDDYILIRSSTGKGFYRTEDKESIKKYRQECLNKGKSIFAPLKKIDRIIKADTEQYSLTNNLRVMRESKGITQSMICGRMKAFDKAFDNSLLSKMENGVCLPTPYQLAKLAEIYSCKPSELINADMY